MTEESNRARPTDPNDLFLKPLAEIAEGLIESGVDRQTALEKAYRAGMAAVEACADEAAVVTEDDALAYVAEMQEYRAGFEERLRAHWGPALDLYEAITEIVFAVSRSFQERHACEKGDLAALLDVLNRLNGQSIRVAREVHALLAAGYPLGALALARTCHEISVRAAVLSQFGSEPGHTDLALRFARHDDVINYKDAVVYQEDIDETGYEAFDDLTMARMKQAHDDAMRLYGKPFASPYGWASGLPGLSSATPKFSDLEALAGLAHHRGLYKWASHFTHADAKALRLAMFERGGRSVILSASTNVALSDPAQQTLRSMYRTFTSLVTSVPISLYDMHMCHVVRILVDKTDRLLVDAEDAVDDAEQRLQAELAERGLRFDPIDGEVAIEAERAMEGGVNTALFPDHPA